MCDAVCHARKYVVPSEAEILLEPNISSIFNTVLFIQDNVVIPSTTIGTCLTVDVLQMLLPGLLELHVGSMSLDIGSYSTQISHLSLV